MTTDRDQEASTFTGEVRKIPEPYLSLLRKLVESLLRRFGEDLISVILYGSVARGEAKPDSDVDLIIVIKDLPKGRFRRQDLFMEVEEDLKQSLDELESRGYHVYFTPIMKTPEEAERFTPLYLDLTEDAVILFDRGDFFRDLLRRLRGKLDELGAERVRLGRFWYWRLKRNYKFGEVIEI